MTIQEAFEKCGLCENPGYESYYYHPDPGCSDYSWWRFDANSGIPDGIQVFDSYGWTPLSSCNGYTLDDQDVLGGQIPSGMPINNLEITPAIYQLLPGVVQDILEGRFRSLADARNESTEPSE